MALLSRARIRNYHFRPNESGECRRHPRRRISRKDAPARFTIVSGARTLTRGIRIRSSFLAFSVSASRSLPHANRIGSRRAVYRDKIEIEMLLPVDSATKRDYNCDNEQLEYNGGTLTQCGFSMRTVSAGGATRSRSSICEYR